MPPSALWEDVYLAAQKSIYAGDSFTSTAKKFLATDIGADLGKCAIPIVGNPDFNAGVKNSSREVLNGVFMDDSASNLAGTRTPVTEFTFDLDVKTFTLFAWLFFQNGAIQPSPSTKTFTPWDSSLCEAWATVGRRLSVSDGISQRIDGVVCNRLTIAGAVGQNLKCTVGLVGRLFDSFFDWNAQASVADFPAVVPLMFKDTIVDGNLVTPGWRIESFSIDLQNNVGVSNYNSSLPYEFRLGKLTGSVTVTAVFDTNSSVLKDFVAGNWNTFIVRMADGVNVFAVSGVITDVKEEGSDEVLTTFTMRISAILGAPITAVYFSITDNVNRGIPVTR